MGEIYRKAKAKGHKEKDIQKYVNYVRLAESDKGKSPAQGTSIPGKIKVKGRKRHIHNKKNREKYRDQDRLFFSIFHIVSRFLTARVHCGMPEKEHGLKQVPIRKKVVPEACYS